MSLTHRRSRTSTIWIAALALTFAAHTQAKEHPQETTASQPGAGSNKNGSAKASALDEVLRSMDENAAKFRTAQADFSWIPYNAVIQETDTPDKGRIYFRRSGKDIEMAAHFQPPDDREIVFADGKVQVYQPKTKILDVYDASAHKDEVESFLVLGFGSSGQGLRKSFDVTYLGEEKIGGVETIKLELVPLSEKIRKNFPRIDLWIDPQEGVSVRQQLFQTGGDYRLADYSNIRVNEKVSDSVFKVKVSGSTKTVTH
jgi:outer membrane lipoprotein-sorting protein